MKTLILSLFLLLVISPSCKKDKDQPKELLLSEVSDDGIPTLRFTYNDSKNLAQLDAYNGAGTAVVTTIMVNYDNNGHISEMTTYSMPGSEAVSRTLVTTDENGNPVNVESYDLQGATPNEPVGISVYTYNTAGQVSTITRRNDEDELVDRQNYSYFADGNLKEIEIFKEAGGQLWLFGRNSYAVSNGSKAVGMERMKALLGESFVASLVSESIQQFTYTQLGTVTGHTSIAMSAREYNEDGSLKRQIQTTTFIQPQNPDQSFNRAFGYILK